MAIYGQKLGIVGVGFVGAKVLSNVLAANLFSEIVLIDERKEKAAGEALDERHAMGLGSTQHVKVYAGNYSDLADADVIVVAATHIYKDEIPAERQDLLVDNIPVLDDVMTGISQHTREAILIFISNPVDTLAHLAVTEYNYPQERVLSTGTMLDSARLRYAVADHYGIDPKSVTGYMLGEHGMSSFAACSQLNVQGIPFDHLSDYFEGVSPLDVDQLTEEVVQSAYDVFTNKTGVTDAAIARVAVELLTTIVLDQDTILPVGTFFGQGIYDLDQAVTFSLPSQIGRQGVVRTFQIPLNDWEKKKLAQSVAVIDQSIRFGRERLQEYRKNKEA
ncbi:MULTISPECIES: NAD(P)-binding domain-containing protein [Aerococcus]|uniref:L-lactate dehydrogenase n=1 Tax=Aerococcus sanguinicola TaxID=119206 RepID=A0A5N1GIQ7_9LACT|nr:MULTISPECIES: NAD(P)-binding domain-containing protein [Aerococcus]KAA9300218.1 L-lactate dehydrogenase [Aerococcus sanguinicola]MDK6369564.1 NAD(P)-binding domain-containing protein [Aerococcus sp. UMB9870]MDK6686067.1 NAD(P)-binding domain-containing protein [Aerococcus sp. UMB8623]MDK6939847.1 NAD(P)-binding domain-containing protein [Aerococcus sp. UMB8487]OFR35711.1 hypothetical protein HMPREF2892_03585 [Aerococcus sp. HMSC061A03]